MTACDGNTSKKDVKAETTSAEDGVKEGSWNQDKAETTSVEDGVKEGSWNQDKTEYTNVYGEKISKEEYDIIFAMWNEKYYIDYASAELLDEYLFRTDFYRNDTLVIYEQDIEWSNDIKYSDFYYLRAKGNYNPYKVIAKATLDDALYEKMKNAFSESKEKGKSNIEEFYSIISKEDIEKVGATSDYEVFGGKTKMVLLDKYEAEGVNVGLFNDETNEMIIYYYNPNLEKEYVQSFEPTE